MNNHSQFIKVSLIVACYNLEEYIARCLESILAQDMTDFEIIAVNDGSTDSTKSILEAYVQKDSRVKIVNLENGGLGWARNEGVKKACGEYIWFVDVDDFIAEGSLSKLYNYATENEADIVIFTFRKLQNDILSEPHSYPYPKNIKMDAVTATRFKLLGEDGAVWNKFCKRTWYLEKNIVFPEKVLWEDTATNCQMLCNARRVFYLDEAFYSYVYRNSSLSSQFLTAKSVSDWFYALDSIKEEIFKANLGKELAKEFICHFILKILWLLDNLDNPEKFKTQQDFQEAKKLTEEKFLQITPDEINSNSYFNLEEKKSLFSIRDLIIRGRERK